jgi:hypothetical protein
LDSRYGQYAAAQVLGRDASRGWLRGKIVPVLSSAIIRRRYTVMSKLLVLSLALTLAIVLTSCSDDKSPTGPSSPGTVSNPPGGSNLPDELRGYWTVKSTRLDGVETPFVDALHRNGGTEAEILGLVGTDEFYLVDYDTSAAAVYSESGTTVATSHQLVLMVLKVNGQTLSPYNTMLSQWTVHGDTLTLTTEVGGKIATVDYVRFDFYNSRYF